MNLKILGKQASKIVGDNSPAILTAIGVTGVLTTSYFTGKASFKAAEIIKQEAAKKYVEEQKTKDLEDFSDIRHDKSWDERVAESLTLQDKINCTWKLYIPAAASAGLTIAAVISANTIGSRRTAAIASAFAISERAFDEYKAKVVEKVTEKKREEINNELAQDRVDKNPISKSTIVMISYGGELCYDEYSKRYFNSDVETIKKAQNDLNYTIIHNGYASLSEFYDLLGLPPTGFSDEVGWTSERLMEFDPRPAMSEDNRPMITIDFAVKPIRNYYRIYP